MSEFDDFADDVAATSQNTRKGQCTVATMLAALSDADALKVRAVLDDLRRSSTAIEAALVKRLGGANVPSSHTIQRHRRRSCHCWRSETK